MGAPSLGYMSMEIIDIIGDWYFLPDVSRIFRTDQSTAAGRIVSLFHHDILASRDLLRTSPISPWKRPWGIMSTTSLSDSGEYLRL
jgi:hypothetical protein